MIELSTLLWACLVSILFGFIAGYLVSDNYAKSDIEINADLDVKKNKLFNTKKKRKVFNILRKKENKV